MTERRVLEVVNGIPIVAKDKTRDPRGMWPGNRGRLEPGGPVYEVDRVTECAAYVHKVYDPPLVREIGRTQLDEAVENLFRTLNAEAPDERVYLAAKNAGHVALHEYRRIDASRGPIEPGISVASRFVEVAG